MTSRSRTVTAIMAASLLALSLTGCARSIDDMVRSNLAHSVENAQDVLWDYRDDLAADPETTIAELGFFTDARDGAPAPADGYYAQYTLMDLDTDANGSTITMLTSGGATTGGGLWYQHLDAAVCFTLTFPVGETRLETGTAECADIPQLDRFDRVVGFDELDVRREVTAADHPAPICQCYSGSECDCPGG